MFDCLHSRRIGLIGVAMSGLLTACHRHPAEVLTAGGANGPTHETTAPSWTPARAPSLALALEAAAVIVDACKAFHVGVVFLDAAGTPKLYYVPDGTSGVHAYAAYRKANSALTFGRPSEQVAELIKQDSAAAARFKAGADNFMVWAGGVPIVVGGEVIGAVGVSGADPSAQDAVCAQAGINSIINRL